MNYAERIEYEEDEYLKDLVDVLDFVAALQQQQQQE